MVPQPVFAVLLLFPVTTALDAEAARGRFVLAITISE